MSKKERDSLHNRNQQMPSGNGSRYTAKAHVNNPTTHTHTHTPKPVTGVSAGAGGALVSLVLQLRALTEVPFHTQNTCRPGRVKHWCVHVWVCVGWCVCMLASPYHFPHR